jgi:predicted DNA-binding protein (MmcQ/YjbR family)
VSPAVIPTKLDDDHVARVGAICARLPEIDVHVDGWAHNYRIRRRSFALLVAVEGPDGRPVQLVQVRADPFERAALLASGHPFFASRSGPDRIGVLLGPDTDWDELAELITESYRLLAPKKLVALLDDPPG